MRIRTKIIAASIGMTLLLGAALFIRHINNPRIITRAVAPEGTEFCVVQTYNWDLEFFTTSCYYRRPSGQWGWFYYDHEDWYWGFARTEVDPVASASAFIETITLPRRSIGSPRGIAFFATTSRTGNLLDPKN